MSTASKILISRTDRLGDVLLALPTVERVRRSLPEAEICFLAQSPFLEAVLPFLQSRGISALPLEGEWKKALREGAFAAALVLFEDREVLRETKAAGIPIRLGPVSKVTSFFRLTHGIRQARSRAEKNEAEYNLELAERLLKQLGVLPRKVGAIEIPEAPEALGLARRALRAVGLSEGEAFLVVHPGMGGSASNLSAENYLKIVAELEASSSFPVVLSQGPADRDREVVQAMVHGRPDLKVVTGIPLGVLREVFRLARLVVAPSTGPLHLAHLVGTDTVGLYAPVQSQRKERWEPWGGTGKSVVLSPEVECPGKRRCLGATCENFFCVDRMTWSGLLLKIGNDLKGARGQK